MLVQLYPPDRYSFLQADAERLPFPDKSFDLTFGSPPYCDARTYGINAQRGCVDWVEWMVRCTVEAQRVTRGPVLWVAAGVTRDRNYWPACEGLMWEWWKRGGDCQLYRPCYWHRVGIPGSGGKDWFRSDVEYVMCFKRPGELPWADNTACGHPPKWAPGGEMSNRIGDGRRVNQWGPVGGPGGMGAKSADGTLKSRSRPSHKNAFGVRTDVAIGTRKNGLKGDGENYRAREQDEGYDAPTLANPGNLVKTVVGGGAMGHPLAHENEAPFPESLVEFFVKSLCPPDGTVFDPFSGSGTTVATALRLGRRGVGTDIRASQVALGRRRVENPMMKRVNGAVEGGGVGVEGLFAEVVGNG